MTVKFSRSGCGVAAVLGLVLSGTAPAHHSFAMFERTQRLSLEGTVRNFEFGYPHTWLWLTVPDGNGGSDIWGFEGASPVELNKMGGWTRTSLKAGDKVSIVFCPLKTGKHGGAFAQVTLSSGRILAGQDIVCQHVAVKAMGDHGGVSAHPVPTAQRQR